MSEDIPDEINLIDYIRVIGKRKWLIILGTLLCMVVAGAISFLVPKIYEAKTYLIVTAPRYQVEFASKEGSKISTPIFQNISAETYSRILLNEHTAKAVLTKLGLDSPSQQHAANRLMGQIKVEYPRNTNLILLKVQDTSKERAAQIANAWAAAFIEGTEEVVSKETGNTYNFILEQLEKAKVSLKTSEEELNKFQKINRVELLREQLSGKIKQIVQYESKLDDAVRSQLIEKARYRELTAQMKEQERTVQPPGSATVDFTVGIHDLTAGMTVKEADTFVNQQLERASSDLTEVENAYKEFSQMNRIEILQAQIDKKVGLLADMKLRTTELEINLEKQRIALERTNQELQKENRLIPVDKGLIGKEEINPLYQSLSFKRAETTIGISQLEKEKGELLRTQQALEKEIQSMKEVFAAQKLKESRLKRQLALAESSYSFLAQKGLQSKIAASQDTGRQRVIGYTDILYKELKDSLFKSEVNIQSYGAEISQLRENIKHLNEEVSGLRKESAEQELTQARLTRSMDTAKSTFEILSKKGEETKISSSIKTGTIQVSVPATPPESPIGPRKRQNVMIAGVVGLLASIILVFFMEFLEKNRGIMKRAD